MGRLFQFNYLVNPNDMKYLIFGIFFIIINTRAFSQGANTSLDNLIDSLKLELELSKVDTLKAGILVQLSENLVYSDPDSAIYYGEKALELAERENSVHHKLGALAFIGNALTNKGDLPKALELGFMAIEMAEDVPIRIAGIGPTYDNMGGIYFHISDYEKALYYFSKMVDLGNSDKVGVAFGYWHMAEVYEETNMLDSAIHYLDQSYQVFGTLNHSYFPDIYHVTPGWYNTRAKIYLKQNQPELALIDLFTSLQMTLKNDQAYYSSNTYNDIAEYYKKFIQPDSIIYYAEKGLAEANRISSTEGILGASEILAEQYELIDHGKALYYYKLASNTRNKLYGAGNIQIIRDMITQYENKQLEVEATRLESRNRIRMNALLGSLFTLAVIAILLMKNNRMKQKAKQKIEKAYDQLKDTQSQLIQSEKMASLGELTAGIAHEIQNPLNFVNNFSDVNKELIDEMKDEIEKGNIKDAMQIADDIAENENKINHHGLRADSIVKGMLQHSRANAGQKELTDINALADEFLRLSYHGLRAKDKSFNALFNLDIDEKMPKIKVVPQDIGRVLLNLINNAFYAVSNKSKQEGKGYSPKVSVSTRSIKKENGIKAVEIRINDNGNGIPHELKEKIFQPFFTTKPTGEGTGLGLSISYDIITKGHDGEMRVESTELSNENINAIKETGTEFIITIPQ